jgi:DNA-binding response OmpR family regulator
MSAAKQIVVVDDDEDILEFIKLTLEYEGFDVQTNTSGVCVRQLTPGHLPDLILMDVHLPGEDGRDLCRRLKTNALTRDLPVILYSAHETAGQLRQVECADDYLLKPFSLDTLINKVKQHLH